MDKEQLIFILIAAAVGIFNWIAKRQQSDGVQPPDPEPRSVQDSSSAQSEEERMRKFMEALGMPPSPTPPPRVQHRRIQQREDPPTQGRQTPRQVQARRAQPPQIAARTIPTSPVSQPASMEPAVLPEAKTAPYEVNLHEQVSLKPAVAAGKEPVTSARNLPVDLSSLPALLRQPKSLRAALVLKEILGPPRSLQSFEGI